MWHLVLKLEKCGLYINKELKFIHTNYGHNLSAPYTNLITRAGYTFG